MEELSGAVETLIERCHKQSEAYTIEQIVEARSTLSDIDEDEVLLDIAEKYIAANKERVICNLKFFKPNRAGYGNGTVILRYEGELEERFIKIQFIEVIEDLVDSILIDAHGGEWRPIYEERWKKFCVDWEADEVEVEFIAPIYALWTNNSVNGLLNANGLTTRHLLSQSELCLINSSYNASDIGLEFDHSFYLFSKIVKIPKSGYISTEFNHFGHLCLLACLMLRCKFGGACNIRFSLIKTVGNLYSANYFLTQSFPLSAQTGSKYDSTHLEHDFEHKIAAKSWDIVSAKEYAEWSFADIKLNELYQPERFDMAKRAHITQFHAISASMDKVVTIMQILENITGIMGNKCIPVTLKTLFENKFDNQLKYEKIEKILQNFNVLRNKYLHGSIVHTKVSTVSLERELTKRYGLLEKLDDDVKYMSDIVVREVIYISMLNDNMNVQWIEYAVGQGWIDLSKTDVDYKLHDPLRTEKPSLVRGIDISKP